MSQAAHILSVTHPLATPSAARAHGLWLAARLGATLHLAPLAPGPAASPATGNGRTTATGNGRATGDGLPAAVAPAVPSADPPAPSAVAEADAVEAALRQLARDLGLPRVPPVHLHDAADLTPEAVAAYVTQSGIELVLADAVETPTAPDADGLFAGLPVPPFAAEALPAPDAMTRLVVGVDFSAHARAALVQARRLAAAYDAALDVVHVIEHPQYVALNTADMLSLPDATLAERKARRRLERFVEEAAGPADVPTTLHLAHGEAAEQLAAFATTHGADALVMATHGTLSGGHRPLGAVAERAVRHAPVPVFLTRLTAPDAPEACAPDDAPDA